MGPWRLEVLRLWRTRRVIALAATFLIVGLGAPILTYYLPELIKGAGGGIQITVPKQTAADALPFGADRLGRDVLAKATKGAEVSILVGVSAALLATLIGTVLGAVAGFFGGKAGDLLEWVYNVFTSASAASPSCATWTV